MQLLENHSPYIELTASKGPRDLFGHRDNTQITHLKNKELMKKLLFLFTILFLTFAACSDDDSNGEGSKKYNLVVSIHTNAKDVDNNTFYWNPGAPMSISVTKNDAASSPEAAIERVDYYLDEELIGASAQDPFRIRYDLNNEEEGAHTLRIRIYWNAEGFSFQSDFQYLVVISATEGNDDDDDFHIYLITKVNATYLDNMYVWRQDEEMEISVTLDEERSTPGVVIERVDFYLDGEFVGASGKSPFTLHYALDQVAVGTHTLTKRVTYNYNDIPLQVDDELVFIVNEAQ